MKNKKIWILVVIVGIIAFISYRLLRIPNSFDTENASLLGLGNTKIHYEKRDGKYYKKVTSSIAGQTGLGVEVEITKADYKNAYKQYQSQA